MSLFETIISPTSAGRQRCCRRYSLSHGHNVLFFKPWNRRIKSRRDNKLHRVPFGYNEMSARYAPLPDLNYVPSIERLMAGGDGKNRQAGAVKGSAALTRDAAENFQIELRSHYCVAQVIYDEALAAGVPKELARVHLPVGRYSRMRATGNLRGWLAFLTLRMDEGAQWEIRQYANAVGTFVQERFPRTWEIFEPEVRKGE